MTAKKFKIAVITYHDRGGGAEKQAQILSETINESGVVASRYVALSRLIPTELASPLLILKAFFKSREIQAADLVISYCIDLNIYAIIASLFLRKKVIVSDRCALRESHLYTKKAVRILRIFLYRFASAVVIQEPNEMYLYKKFFNTNTIVVNNFWNKPTSTTDSRLTSKRIHFIGRLEEQKNPILAINSFIESKLYEQGWILNLYGEGSLRPRIEQLIKTTKIDKYIKLYGFVADQTRLYRNASIVLITSLYEGQSNVLMESISNQSAIVATMASDTQNLLKSYNNGIAVKPTINEIAQALHMLSIPNPNNDLLTTTAQPINFEKLNNQTATLWLNLISNSIK